MRKERITDKQATYIIIIYYIGSTFILGVGGKADNDAWISVLIGVIFAIPMLLVYARILSIYPEKGLFEILNLVFGKLIGKVFSVLYIWYSFHLGALVIRNFGEFVDTTAMPETPFFVPMICLGIVCIAAARSGIEVIGRISAYSLPLIIVILISIQLMGIPQWEMSHIKPFLSNGIIPILQGGFNAFSFPFSESVVLIGAFFSLQSKKSPYKVYLIGTVIAGALLTIITLRNIFILGGQLSSLYFPSHEAVSRISIGYFLQRVEVSVAVVLILGVFIKTSICMLVSSVGIAKLFNLHDYRSIVIQVGLLMVYVSYSLYDSIFEMRAWAFDIYRYYAFPFQVIIPILLLLIAEWKNRKRNSDLQKNEASL